MTFYKKTFYTSTPVNYIGGDGAGMIADNVDNEALQVTQLYTFDSTLLQLVSMLFCICTHGISIISYQIV